MEADMTITCNDLDKRILAAFAAENAAYTNALAQSDELAELRKKARMYDILSAASKREIEAIWDAANATGCPIEPMVEALGKRIL
jgi:hypothetical protein